MFRSSGFVGPRLVDQANRGFQGGQVSQAQEVHLEQAGFFDVTHFPLGGDDLLGLVLVRDALERHQVFERPVGDDDAGGVGADVAIDAFEAAGEVDQAADLAVFLGQLLELGLFLQGGGDRDIEPRGHQLGDLIDAGERDVEHPADVLDGGLGLHGAEGADLGDVGRAILLAHVFDDLVAAGLAQVDVDIRRFVAVGVQKPLEQQVVLQRADVRDFEQVTDQRAAGRPTR